MNRLLDGIRVLDFTRVLAGPLCTKILVDLGASVDKIEPPGGDLGRLAVPVTGGISHFYAQQNAGKRNISIDLNFSEGREVVKQLADQADVIVENFRPGTLDFYGLDYASVARRNPKVVYASISGYGQTGPWKNRGGFAPTVQAEIGFTRSVLSHFGIDEDGARHDASAHADVYTGLHATIGILAALHQRSVTGVGQHVDVAMAATMLSLNERFHSEARFIDTDGEPIVLGASDSPIIRTRNGTVVTIAGSPILTAIFRRYCAMMRRTDLQSDPRFLTPLLRRENQRELIDIIRSWMETFSDFRDLEAQVKVSGMDIGTVRSIDDFLISEWAEHRQPIVELDDGDGGKIVVPRAAWLFSGGELEMPTTVAARGQHNSEVLSELGFSPDDLARFAAAGVLTASLPGAQLSNRNVSAPADCDALDA